MKNNYKMTMYACFIGYIVQAVVNSFVPLLFVTFQTEYHIPLTQITLLITVNFVIQLVVDLLSAGFVDKIGYRASAIIAHACAGTGIFLLTILPELFSNQFYGILLAVMVYAIGGGLIEVLISPILEACPTDNKESAMSLLHSFYCWGCTGVVLLSTLFFSVFGTSHWKILALIWVLLPTANLILFTKVPIYSLHEEGESGMSISELFRVKVFWLLMAMMLCAGASEQAVSQWASTFAEKGLHIQKTVGDLVGPMMFSVLMGLSRLIYGKYGEKMDLMKFMIGSGILCVICYLLVSVSLNPISGLIGCIICGFSVGIMWPGTISISSEKFPAGGTAMFALLAMAGDLGGSIGPGIVGRVTQSAGDNIRAGMGVGLLFPVILLIMLFIFARQKFFCRISLHIPR